MNTLDMNTLETIVWVVLFISGIVICAYALYTLIEWKRELKQAQIEYQKYLKSLIPGSIWIKREQFVSENPFKSYESQKAKVIETRMNQFGELWVRYMQRERVYEVSANDFGDVYKIMEE